MIAIAAQDHPLFHVFAFGWSDPRQITPKGSRRQLYPREGSGAGSAKRNEPRDCVAVTAGNGNAGSENAGRSYSG